MPKSPREMLAARDQLLYEAWKTSKTPVDDKSGTGNETLRKSAEFISQVLDHSTIRMFFATREFNELLVDETKQNREWLTLEGTAANIRKLHELVNEDAECVVVGFDTANPPTAWFPNDSDSSYKMLSTWRSDYDSMVQTEKELDGSWTGIDSALFLWTHLSPENPAFKDKDSGVSVEFIGFCIMRDVQDRLWITLSPSPSNAFMALTMRLMLDKQQAVNYETSTVDGLPPKVKAQMKRERRVSTVQVVNLNEETRLRRQYTQETGRQVEFDHRFEVRGHWRNQRVGEGRLQVRRTWVASYVKGPEEAPLVKRDKVFKK